MGKSHSPELPIWHGVMAAQQPSILDRATANVLADTEQAYITHSRMRNYLRAAIVLLVIAAVITLTFLKYVTEESLRSATYTARVSNYEDLSEGQFNRSMCPCAHTEFAWASFVSYADPLAPDVDSTKAFCEEALRPRPPPPPMPPPSPPPPPPPRKQNGCKSGSVCSSNPNEYPPSLAAPEPPAAAPVSQPGFLASNIANVSDPVSVFIGSAGVLTDADNFLPLLTCGMAVTRVLAALSPNPLDHVSGFGDTFSTVGLLSEAEMEQHLAGFLGETIRTYQQDAQAQLSVLLGLTEDFKDEAATASEELGGDAATASAAAALARTTSRAAVGFSRTAADLGTFRVILESVLSGLRVDYDAFAIACQPQYCDVTEVKSVWARITEFLSLLGGLWTMMLGVGLVLWWMLDHMLPLK